MSRQLRCSLNTSRAHLRLGRVMGTVIVLGLTASLSFCTPYATIDNSVTAVQDAMRAYKRHCNVPVGGDGPGTCKATDYAIALQAYSDFQRAALTAATAATETGHSARQIVADAATLALHLLSSLP